MIDIGVMRELGFKRRLLGELSKLEIESSIKELTRLADGVSSGTGD